MNRIRVAVYAGVLFMMAVPSAFASIIDGPIVSPVNGHSYYLTSSEGWPQSEAEALLIGGHLATVRSNAEISWIVNTFSPLDADRAVHIGINDIAQEGHFVWASGEPVSFVHWGQGEPNNFGNEDWGELVLRGYNLLHPGDWNDGSDAYSGVIEVVPEPCTAGFVLCGIVLLRGRRPR